MMPAPDSLDYTQFRELKFNLAQHTVLVISKPGLPDWDAPRISDLIIAEYFNPQPQDKIFFLGCGNGAIIALLSRRFPANAFWVSDLSFLALECTRRTIQANQIANVTIYQEPSLPPEQASTFDFVILIPEKGRKLARKWLLEAFNLLKPGGKLILAGSTQLGIQSIIADAALLFAAKPQLLAYKKGHRAVYLEKKTPAVTPDWAYEPGIAPATWYTFKVKLYEKTIQIFSLPGVFSYDRLDEGTALLLDHLPQNLSGRILDVGCGYGVIGTAIAVKTSHQPNHIEGIDLLDSNLYALACAQKTISANREVIHPLIYERMRVFPGDLMGDVEAQTYDMIVSNPPFHAGKMIDYSITHALIAQARQVLRKGGRLIIVANLFIRYEKIMQTYFKTVKLIQRTNRYHLLEAQNPL